MNTLLLSPTDILFFRDGRPMGGASSGYGAAWPLPTVTNLALHAALHRADIKGAHRHDQILVDNGNRERVKEDARRFGSLTTVGPFPVLSPQGGSPRWFFPRPADAGKARHAAPTLSPGPAGLPAHPSSLPGPGLQPVVSSLPPAKGSLPRWWSNEAWQAYLAHSPQQLDTTTLHFSEDRDIASTEHHIGIGIDPERDTQDGKRFYTAHYLRLLPDWHLGLFAEAREKVAGDPSNTRDLIHHLFTEEGHMIVGGQQRLCTVDSRIVSPLPMPLGITITGTRVKWVLLTPSIWPALPGNDAKGIEAHHGGWLPTWISPSDLKVKLKAGDTSRGEREGREAWRRRVAALPAIGAQLVAAIVGKPEIVTGYAGDNRDTGDGHGAKPTQLAVPAGSVYYFECPTEEEARKLANALNWHGSTEGTAIVNRRSSAMGEKGFGLGVCGTWQPHAPSQSHPAP